MRSHEYFRRTLCNLVGRDVENGEIPISEMERFILLCALRFERAFTDVTLVVNSAQAPLRHPEDYT